MTAFDMATMSNFIIVENHHEVLLPWAKCRQQASQAPRLITLDHHTDTSAPFRKHLRHLSGAQFSEEQKICLDGMSYQDPESLQKSLKSLAHDEHIVTALKKDVVSAAFVIAHNARDTDLLTYQQHQIVCYSAGREPSTTAVSRAECDRVLESTFLEGALAHFERILREAREADLFSRPYILDIDMDVFNTRKPLTRIISAKSSAASSSSSTIRTVFEVDVIR